MSLDTNELFNVFDGDGGGNGQSGDVSKVSSKRTKDETQDNVVNVDAELEQLEKELGPSSKKSDSKRPKRKRDSNAPGGEEVITIKDSDDEGVEDKVEDDDDDDDVEIIQDPETNQKRSKLMETLVEDVSALERMPRIKIHRVQTVEACLHEVAVPPDSQYVPLSPAPEKPAKEYPFILDPFQKEALLCLENLQSVLVSAHTSAGKTVVATYAIAMSLRAKQRVIYTSPIKALSNQKYRELYEEFQDVGLMTGDVTINPNASCIVMTTEILRSMLYRGSEIMREVAWVVFDEIHYMRDKERGVVWEETIILLPDSVRYVFLSATIPNAIQFAEWIAHTHKQPCHVVYTEYRPTPLQHYIYPSGAEGTFLVVNENGEFMDDNFNSAMNELQKLGGAAGSNQYGRRGGMKATAGHGQSGTGCFRLVKMVSERDLTPVIVFSFSRKDCEAYGIEAAKLNFNSDEEQSLVTEIFENAIGTLSDEDRKLPQIESVLPFLRRGVGIHHSGLLPLLKETIEILFQEGLIKVLFATETFAMGLNMPARTVLFTSNRKFDGKSFRYITSGEYIQMSGRAGRRGIDERGIVIMMVEDNISPAACKQIIKGQPDPLNSAFRLTYNMVLNLLRVEEINPEYMMEKSFFQFQNYSTLPEAYAKLAEIEQRYRGVDVANEAEVSSYWDLKQQSAKLKTEIRRFIHKPQYLLPFLQPGRLLHIVRDGQDFGWGPVVNFTKRQVDDGSRTKSGRPPRDDDPVYIVEVLLRVTKASVQMRDIKLITPCPSSSGDGETVVVPVTHDLIADVCAVRLYLPRDVRPLEAREAVNKLVVEVEQRFPAGLPLIDPEEDMQIKDPKFKELMQQLKIVDTMLPKHPLSGSANMSTLLATYEKKQQLATEVRTCKAELKRRCSLLHLTQLKAMKRVLRRMGYISATDIIETKGRVACEVSCADELMMTELLLGGEFNKLTPAECAALLSCLVSEEKGSEMPKLNDNLSTGLRHLQETARKLAKLMKECKALDDQDEDEYVEQYRPYTMALVHAWCQGASFSELCKMSTFFEGGIVRCMRQLEETLREMTLASRAIGSVDLEDKFSEAIRLLKRDIVFAASLYL